MVNGKPTTGHIKPDRHSVLHSSLVVQVKTPVNLAYDLGFAHLNLSARHQMDTDDSFGNGLLSRSFIKRRKMDK
jgi:hypothetical protein